MTDHPGHPVVARRRTPDVRMDVERYKERTARLDISDLDLDVFAQSPLPADALRCLRYMHDVEHHTVCYLRDLLVTAAHKDPRITSFLTFWSFEEYWHGDAIASVLRAHGERVDTRVAHLRSDLGWRDRAAPMAHLLGSLFAGESFIAIHMTWGAINEWTTQAGYARLAVRADHPVLSDMLHRIMRQEGRHIDFYAAEAHRRLEHDRRAQRLTRFALRHLWGPVGSTIMPQDEVDFLVRYLFDGDDGRDVLSRIDRHIDRLPGLGGLNLMRGGLEATLSRRQM